MRVLVINGPNLNMLGQRDQEMYGRRTLDDIRVAIEHRAQELQSEVISFQANGEGELIDFVQHNAAEAGGIIINAGALTHYGYSLRDALADARLPVVEVHLSNIHAREEWRHESVIASIAKGQISGLGWRGYLFALESLIADEGER